MKGETGRRYIDTLLRKLSRLMANGAMVVSECCWMCCYGTQQAGWQHLVSSFATLSTGRDLPLKWPLRSKMHLLNCCLTVGPSSFFKSLTKLLRSHGN